MARVGRTVNERRKYRHARLQLVRPVAARAHNHGPFRRARLFDTWKRRPGRLRWVKVKPTSGLGSSELLAFAAVLVRGQFEYINAHGAMEQSSRLAESLLDDGRYRLLIESVT